MWTETQLGFFTAVGSQEMLQYEKISQIPSYYKLTFTHVN